MPKELSESQGPFLKIISESLKLWLKAQCDSVESIDITLYGSLIKLLQGNLPKVKLLSTKLSFKNIPMHKVAIEAKDISIKTKKLRESKVFLLNRIPKISLEVSFSVADINKILLSKNWESLSKDLAQRLLGNVILKGLEIDNQNLILNAYDPQIGNLSAKSFTLEASEGTILITSKDSPSIEFKIPMDPNIMIQSARLDNEMLLIKGQAIVSI
ncbi:LmeA family phospholipid-binding protein [Prochlorococcus sp. MIT 1300]|uniref:LmeA family phospholipid-binding protein n=1 Tax=Prochlorococcus sp. MIT 1300 TaxID=3096218 RepID=UPI002A755E84|nr:LmeA family phospholipid-binding protein [Prochlorococcus sp. MIT 1300]